MKKLDLSLAHVNDNPTPPAPAAEEPEFRSEIKTIINPEDIQTPTPKDDPKIGEIVAGRYEVVRQIGKGGMGVVVLAKDVKLGRFVAIKSLVFKSTNMKVVQRRFLREAQTIASLGHVNIVNVFDIGQDGETGYITMEYVAGPQLDEKDEVLTPPKQVTLEDYVRKMGPMKPDHAMEFMSKLCNAMGYAHKQGTLHRDIKPTNNLLTETMEPKIVDFGLARPIDITKTEEITLEGTMLGTPEYSAPEQWGDLKEVGRPSDVYALGGVFWYLLTGRIPRFFRESELQEGLGEILGKALSQRPNDRYPTTDDMNQALQILIHKDEATLKMNVASPSDTQGTPDGSWYCLNCTMLNPESAHFCTQCGASGVHDCILCGKEMKVGVQFCPHCGEDVKFAEETAGIFLEAKNHANFLELETALLKIEPLIQKGGEAKQLAKEWQKVVDNRRNLLGQLEEDIQTYELDHAVEAAEEVKALIPGECLSESDDFSVVVKFSELRNDLRKMLIGAATKAHEEHNLDRFSRSIQSLNRIFGEDVCGAVNSQLSSILNELDQAMSKAGLALGMNCISKALEIIEEIPPWTNGDLGKRRTRLYQSCTELKAERDQAVIDIEVAVYGDQYSEALTLIAKMGRFRLPPEHSEVEPAPADIDANERITKVDKVLMHTIEDNCQAWINQDNWGDVRNAMVALEQGESKNWRDLTQRLKFSIKNEIKTRFENANELEHKGNFIGAEQAWSGLLTIPMDMVPPDFYRLALEFKNRRNVNDIRKAKYTATNGAILLSSLFFCFSSWMIWFPLYVNQAFWEYLSVHVWDGFGLPMSPRQVVGFENATIPALLQLFLFALFMAVSQSKLLRRSPQDLRRYSALPRLLTFGAVATISPLSMVLYEFHYHWIGIGGGFIAWILVTLVWVGLDFLRGFDKKRVPANFALTISWVVASFLLMSSRFGPEIVPRTFMHPEGAQLFKLTHWPNVAIFHTILYLVIIIVEHLIFKRKLGEGILSRSPKDTDDFSTTSMD